VSVVWRDRNPLRCAGTELPPNVLLLAKAVAIGLLLHGYVAELPAVFLPFFPRLDAPDPHWFRRVLIGGACIAAAALLFNVRVRIACLILGAVFLLAIASSMPYYRNAIVYSGCVLLLAGLSDADERPWLLRAQVSLLYLGAGSNKWFEADWRSGQYMEHWLIHVLTNPYYEAAAAQFPPMLLSWMLSWLTIVLELTVGLAVWWRKSVAAALATAASFHVATLLLTHQDFGIFFTAVCASFLAFAEWPASVTLSYDPRRFSGRVLHGLLRRVDFDRRIAWRVHSGPITLVLNERVSQGAEAMKRVLLLLPVSAIAVVLLLASPKWVRWGTALGTLLLIPVRVSRPVGEGELAGQ